MTDRHEPWTLDEVRPLTLESLDERRQRYRLAQPKSDSHRSREYISYCTRVSRPCHAQDR